MGDREVEKTLARVQEKAGRIRELELICKQLTNQFAAVVQTGSLATVSEAEGSEGLVSVEERTNCEHVTPRSAWESGEEAAHSTSGVTDLPSNQGEYVTLVKHLQRKVQGLEGGLAERDELNAMLRAENRQKTAELLEFQQQELQQAITEKDSTIAVLELQPNYERETEKLRKEREELKAQLKDKVQQRSRLHHMDPDIALESPAGQCHGYSKEQVCDVLRTLELDSMRLKAYIDHLLALILDRNTELLEGMPRTQQSAGMGLDLLAMASLPELVEELHEKEKHSQTLQMYASLLLKRIIEQAPDLLQSTKQP